MFAASEDNMGELCIAYVAEEGDDEISEAEKQKKKASGLQDQMLKNKIVICRTTA